MKLVFFSSLVLSFVFLPDSLQASFESSGEHRYLNWKTKLVESEGDYRFYFTFSLKKEFHVNSNQPLSSNYIPTVLELIAHDQLAAIKVKYPEPVIATYYEEELSVYEGGKDETIEVSFQLAENRAFASVVKIPFAFRFQPCDDKYCFPPETIKGVLEGKVSDVPKKGLISLKTENLPTSLALVLSLAFLGGLLLNFMPCVFPLLTLKAYSLIKITGSKEGNFKKAGSFKRNQLLAFILGSFISFFSLGSLFAVLKILGDQVNWGIQFQNPFYILILSIIFWVLSLNLLDVFKLNVPLSYSLSSKINADRRAILENFLSGVLLTLFSTSCTAPFLGIAMGYALTRSTPLILILFSIIGLGFVSPYLLLLFFKGFSRYLPKPGPWMRTFKQVTAFPIFLIIIWFLSILNALVSFELAFDLLLFLCLLAFLLYFWGKLPNREPRGYLRLFHPLAFYGFLIFLTTMFVLTAVPQKQVNVDFADLNYVDAAGKNPGYGKNASFNSQAFEDQLQDGNLFYVHYTAKWCLNCKVNEVVLESEAVKDFFKENDIAYFVADWTKPNPFIAEKISQLNRVGIPLDVYYYYRKGELQSYILPNILTTENIKATYNAISF